MIPLSSKQRSLLPLGGSTNLSLVFTNAPRVAEENELVIDGGSATWNNGKLSTEAPTINFKPVVYQSNDGTVWSGNETRNSTIDVSEEYFPIGQVTITNLEAIDEETQTKGIRQIWVNTTIDLVIDREKDIDILPHQISLPFNFTPTVNNADDNFSDADKIHFPSAETYQALKIINPETGSTVEGGSSPFVFRYVGAIEGPPKSKIQSKDDFLAFDDVDIAEGETKEFTLYGRIFTIEPNIISESDLEFYKVARLNTDTDNIASFLSDTIDRDFYLNYFSEVPKDGSISVDNNYNITEDPLNLRGILIGSLKPKNGIHVNDAAKLLGYHHFNWYQELRSAQTDNTVVPDFLLVAGDPSYYTITDLRVDPPPYSFDGV